MLGTLVPARAQQPPPQDYRLRVDVQLVNVDVAVTDAEGNFLPNLKAHNFRLREEGEPQDVSHFAPTRAPVRIVLLVEASPAVFLLRAEHLAATHRFLDGLRQEDEVALATYAREPAWVADFTRDKAEAHRQLDLLTGFGLGMADMNVLDAVAATVEHLGAPAKRTAVLVVGTGLDSGSRVHWEELERRVGGSQVTVFGVALGRLLRGDPKAKKKRGEARAEAPDVARAFAEADARLRALAEASAGQAYFPQSGKELEQAYREITERLRNLYSLGYYPSRTARDGSYRKIHVELVDENGAPLVPTDAKGRPVAYRVFARPGYFASREP